MATNERFSSATGMVHGQISRIMHALQRSSVVSYVLDSQFRIMYCNPAWNCFARSNGAPQLTSDAVEGCHLFDAIPEVLRAFYTNAFGHVLNTGRVWEKSYECSSPTVFREYRMRIHLLKPPNWFVVTNPLVFERPHERTSTADTNTYTDANGLITMCAHCRCSQRLDHPDQWDFVPEYLELGRRSVIKVSHGLCPICRAFFYSI
jgi:hypothetical protein